MSNYDTSTATTIAANGGVAGTLLGTLVPLLPPFLPGLVGILVLVRRYALATLAGLATALVSPAYGPTQHGALSQLSFAWQETHVRGGRAWGLIKLHHWATLWHSDRWPVVAAVIAGGIAFVDPPAWMRAAWYNFRARYRPVVSQGRWVRPNSAAQPVHFVWIALYRLAFTSLMVAVGGLSFFFLHSIYQVPRDIGTLSDIVRRPWVSVEQLDVVGKPSVRYVGYTITTKDGWQLLLDENSRTITYIKADKVTGRQVCVLEQAKPIPLPLIALKGAQYPAASECANPTPQSARGGG